MNINFDDYDIVHAGVSGGKDSQAAATWLVKESGCPSEKIRVTFCDTGNEHQWTYDHVKYIGKCLGIDIITIKNELDFYQYAEKKGMFPRPIYRFCTTYLKMEVTQKYINQFENKKVLLISGIRAEESTKRAKMEPFYWNDYFACDTYLPLFTWTLREVWKYLADHDQHVNPLYSLGARRVGCFPCMMSNKHEIRMIAEKFPDRIDMIRGWENKINSTFFAIRTAPDRFSSKECVGKDGIKYKLATIDDIVEWSKTARGGKNYEFNFDDSPTCINNSGSCE